MPSTPRSNSARPSRRTSAVAFIADPPEPDDPLLGFDPYVHRAPRRNSITPERQRGFIAALAASGIVTQAAREIGVSLEALYKLRHLPGAEEFSAAWDAALDRGIGRLEDCALELAIAGEELPIVSAGKLLGTYRKHNFGHIRFVLSQRSAARWNVHGGDYAALRPGHPVYDRLRAEWNWERQQAEPDRRGTARDFAPARGDVSLRRRKSRWRGSTRGRRGPRLTVRPDRAPWARAPSAAPRRPS